MKIVFDTNIIVDAVASRQPFCQDAQKLLLSVAEEKCAGFVTANSVTDIYYIIRRIVPENESREIIRKLLYSLNIIEIGGPECWQALDMKIDDYEDGLLAVCAANIGADYIVSRDKDFIKSVSPVPVILPSEVLNRI